MPSASHLVWVELEADSGKAGCQGPTSPSHVCVRDADQWLAQVKVVLWGSGSQEYYLCRVPATRWQCSSSSPASPTTLDHPNHLLPSLPKSDSNPWAQQSCHLSKG